MTHNVGSTDRIVRFVVAAAALVIVVLGVSSITLWRVYTGSAPETDRAVATRQMQARATQARMAALRESETV